MTSAPVPVPPTATPTGGRGHRPAPLTTLVLALALASAGIACAAAPARAEAVDLAGRDSVVLQGRGYGHGRGMSQNGAQGAALSGLDHRAVLAFYYPGAEAYDAGDPAVRVRVSGSGRQDATGPYTALSGTMLVLDDLGSGASTPLPAGTGACRARPAGTGVVVSCTGGASPVQVSGPAVRVRSGVGGTGVAVDGGQTRSYRGSVTVHRDGAGTVAVVTSSLQEYLRGVVPLEMPSSWHPEALRAQSVAARTYALRAVADRPAGSTWDVCDTTACQVFQGMSTRTASGTTVHERASTDAAVEATRGLALRHQGRPAFTQFSASNGGWSTASPASAGTPYLAARADPYDGVTASTSHRWSTTVPVSRVAAAWPSVGRPTRLEVLERDGRGEWGGRATSVRLTGTLGSTTVSGEQVRAALDLRSTWFALDGSSPPGPPPGPPPGAPFGAVDAVVAVPGGVSVRGWAADPDGQAQVPVHVFVDGVGLGIAGTGLPRPDVAAAVPGAGPDRGYLAGVPVTGSGPRTVCVYAVDAVLGAAPSPGSSTLGCRSVVLGAPPLGALDELAPGFASVQARGWAWDPDTAGATAVHLWLDGKPAAAVGTGAPRPDVRGAYPLAGTGQGWSTTVAAAPGAHRLCAYGIDAQGTGNPLLGCRDVVVGAAPAGALETASPSRAAVDVSGWAADPDTRAGTAVHVYLAGRGWATSAAGARPDLTGALGPAASSAGWSTRVPSTGGPQQACAYGIDAGGQDHRLLGCRDVVVPSLAFGHLDGAAWADGRLTVSGWAVDPDVLTPVQVHVYADGVPLAALEAGAARPDVAPVLPLHGGSRGWSAVLPAAGRPGMVCAYAVDVAQPTVGTRETNPLLGCRTP